MKVVIMCAGKSLRFGRNPKWISKINEERNIDRIVNMVQVKGYRPTVTVYRPNKFHLNGIKCSIVLGNNNVDTQRFSNAFPLNEETIYLYGDVYYNQVDFDLIFNPIDSTKFYGRKGPNPLTKKPYGELLGIHVLDYKKFMDSVQQTYDEYMKHEIARCIGIEVYRIHEGLDPKNTNLYNDNFVELSLYTDDFDSLEELENIRELYADQA